MIQTLGIGLANDFVRILHELQNVLLRQSLRHSTMKP